MMEVGRVCVKTAGRDAGGFCVIIDVVDDKFVEITGPKVLSGVRRRKCNISHLEMTNHKIKIKKGAKDEEVIEAIKKAGLEKLFSERIKIKI
jgi:large subunit ribosomal protein L14e